MGITYHISVRRAGASFFPQTDGSGRLTPSGVVQSGVMLLGSIYIPVPQNVRYKVNIACFLVQCVP